MSATDRELLEAAARAAGINLEERWFWQALHDTEWGLYANNANGTQLRWNPLTDDGDALRLAVKLHLDVRFSTGEVAVIDDYAPGCYMRKALAIGDDADAATRRCIVIAAATVAGSPV